MHSALPTALLALSTGLLSSMACGASTPSSSYFMEQNPAVIVQSVDDASIAKALRARLAWQGNTQGIRIAVSCRNGVVSLRGTVLTTSDYRVAVATARHTPGVQQVDTRGLQIGTTRPVSNTEPAPGGFSTAGQLSL